MDGREDQIILVLVAGAGEIGTGLRGIERQLGEEALAAGIARGDLFELLEIARAHRRVVIDVFEDRIVETADPFDLRDEGRLGGK